MSFGLCPSSWIKYKNIKTTAFQKKALGSQRYIPPSEPFRIHLIIIIISNTEIVTCIFIIIIKCSFNQFTVSELLMFCYQLRSSLNNTLTTLASYCHSSNLHQYLAEPSFFSGSLLFTCISDNFLHILVLSILFTLSNSFLTVLTNSGFFLTVQAVVPKWTQGPAGTSVTLSVQNNNTYPFMAKLAR